MSKERTAEGRLRNGSVFSVSITLPVAPSVRDGLYDELAKPAAEYGAGNWWALQRVKVW